MSIWVYVENNRWWKLPQKNNDTDITIIKDNSSCNRCNTFIKTGYHFKNNIFCINCYKIKTIYPNIFQILLKQEISIRNNYNQII